ncbi:MAG: helix-turn-helix transcriptional regulator [Bacteroidia bacterium]|nr:helix-turn-helix transcriptional regulator [Bacteroidia bacterium]
MTGREIDMLNLVCQGLSSHEIADQLGLSERTVENHRLHLFSKADVRNVPGLIFWAIKNHLMRMPE